MKSKISLVVSCIIAFFLFSVTVCAVHITSSEIIAYNLAESGTENVQEWIDTTLAENAGNSSEWYVIALSKMGDYDFTAYQSALEMYVKNNDVRSATSRQKYVLALCTVGSDSDYISETMENSIGEQGLMSYVYGLHLLNNGCTSSQHTIESVTDQILSMQLSDGGWAIMGEYGDPDVTAMTIQALAPYYQTDEDVTESVDKAVQFLSVKQLESGGYKSMGRETSESISQVIVALSAIGIDAENDNRFVKNDNTLFSALEGFRLPDGSYCHEADGNSNSTSTVQAFMAAVAYENNVNLFFCPKKDDAASKIQITYETETSETLTATDTNVDTVDNTKSYKPIACVIVVVLAVLVCGILLLLKKRNKKNFMAVAALSAVAFAVIIFTDFSTAEEYYGSDTVKSNPVGTVSLEIRCDTVAGREDYIPENGIILAESKYVFEEGETVYDILVEACRKNGIQTDFSNGYVSGMNYIYEFDFGDLSGWMYFVNGSEASVGCDSFVLDDGDEIRWIYSCEMGNDLK